jgi:pSer/pThr/pTyr-binding forkhead associated (FHA) protein
MAKLQVYLHGQLLHELNLQPGQEYFAGRGSQSQILLTSERGISRQHMKIVYEGSHWYVRLLSKFGGIIYDGNSVEQIELSGEIRFSVPPYEFYFNETAIAAGPVVITPAEEEPFAPQVPTAATAPETSVPSISIPLPSDGPTPAEGNLDATAVVATRLETFLKIINNKTKTEEVLKLEGHLWAAGRHPSCEIVINDNAISRKHFDITRTDEGYFVTDHNSSNGTLVNGEKIAPEKPYKIVSGDVMTVRHIEFIFEIHDGALQSKMQNLPVPLDSSPGAIDASELNQDSYGSSNALPSLYQGEEGPAVLRIPPSSALDKLKNPNKIQIGIGILGLILVYGLFFSGGDKPASVTPNQPGEGDSASQAAPLTDDKKKEVVDIFNLAQNYYIQRKYVMCLAQVDKLHTIIPFYSNSKELESLCKQAQELEQIEQDRERKETAKSDVEERIRQVVAECRAKVTVNTTKEEVDTCLQPGIELDPQDAAILELQNMVQIQANNLKEKLEKQVAFAQRKQAGQALYNRAMNNFKAGQYKQALADLRNFVNGKYPALNQEEDEARRAIASISKTLEDSLNEQIDRCQKSLDRSDLKAAVISCDLVLKENPSNARAKAIRQKAYSQLRREMKSLYEDSALEESLGNIDAAKEKWSKILDSTIPSDDYYKKASQKLKKYGIGI